MEEVSCFIMSSVLVLISALSRYSWKARPRPVQTNTQPSSRWLQGNAALGPALIQSREPLTASWSDRTSANPARQPVRKHLILSGSALCLRPFHLHKYFLFEDPPPPSPPPQGARREFCNFPSCKSLIAGRLHPSTPTWSPLNTLANVNRER